MSDTRIIMLDLTTGKLHAVQPTTITSPKVNKNGDSMMGPLVLSEFTEDDHAVSKGYVDALFQSMGVTIIPQHVSSIDGVSVGSLNVNDLVGERDVAITLLASGQPLPDAEVLWSVTISDGDSVIDIVEGTGQSTNFILIPQTSSNVYDTATYRAVGLYNPGILNLPFDVTITAG